MWAIFLIGYILIDSTMDFIPFYIYPVNPLLPKWTYKSTFEILVKSKILNPYERRDHEPIGDRLQQA